ncbi:MAG: (Fe-S)-binding protein [Candidatus Jordarchaeum sp.]|uniref:(Fe-S)-binding protein n=1 Tax=Candidatus Jordarchaeum sp. TaxID=2823881 RepID=UPI00404A1FB0
MPALNAFQVYKLLPQTNCGECGEANCMAFAVALLGGKKKVEDCPPLMKESKYTSKLSELQKIFTVSDEVEKTGLILHEEKCSGCGNCTAICPENVAASSRIAGGKGDECDNVVFRVEDGKVKIVNLEKCRRSGKEKTCRICELFCGPGAIEIRMVGG